MMLPWHGNTFYQHDCLFGRESIHHLGLYSLRRRCLISIGIPITNLRRSWDRLRFVMGIPIPVRQHLLSEQRPRGTPCRNPVMQTLIFLSASTSCWAVHVQVIWNIMTLMWHHYSTCYSTHSAHHSCQHKNSTGNNLICIQSVNISWWHFSIFSHPFLPNRLRSDKKSLFTVTKYYFISYTLFYVVNTQIP